MWTQRRFYLLPEPTAPRRALAERPAGDPAIRVNGDGAALTATVRDDVSRVAAVLVDGSERTLEIADGRVSYQAGTPNEAARLLQAYVGDQRVSTVSLAVSCGGVAGPCSTEAISSTEPEYAFYAALPPGATTLARVNPRTLLPVGRRLVIRPGFAPSYGRSPGGRYLALAARDRAALRIVDLQAMRIVRTVELGGRPGATARIVAWLSDDRLAALTQRFSEPTRRYVRDRTILFVDPLAGRVLSRRPLTNKLALREASVTAGRLVLALRSSTGAGSTITLVVADADGRVRTQAIEVGRRGGALNQTAVAVEPSGRRAFVLGWATKRATPPVVEVDLDSLTATPWTVQIAGSAVLERAALSGLQAAAFGDASILVTGAVSATTRLGDEIVPAAGVFVIDTRSWTARLLDPRAIYFDAHRDRLVAYGINSSLADARRGRRGSGITVYDTSGNRLAHLYGYRPFSTVKLAGEYGHVLLGPTRRKRLVFDLRSGKPLGMLPKLDRLVVLLEPPPRPAPARRPAVSSAQPASPSTVSGSASEPLAFQRPATQRDAFPYPRFYAGQRVTDSRRIASYYGRRRAAYLYLLKTAGSRGRQLCTVLVHRAIGGGCNPEGAFDRSPVWAGHGQLLSGVAANYVTRIVVVGTAGRRHHVRLTPDKGFIFDCRAYNGCTCVVRWLDAYDAAGRRVAHQDLSSPACRRNRRAGNRDAATASPATAVPAGVVQQPNAYTFSTTGRKVRVRQPGPRLFYRRGADAFLLGTLEGRAFYRVRVRGTRLTCFAVGRARRLGELGSIGCPHRLGDRPLVEFSAAQGSPSPRIRRIEIFRAEGFAADEVARIDALNAGGEVIASTTPTNNIYAFPNPLPQGFAKAVARDENGNELLPRAGIPQKFPEFLHGPRGSRAKSAAAAAALRDPIRRGSNRGVTVILGRNGVAVFDTRRAIPFVRRAAGTRPISFNCFRLTGAHHAEYVGVSYRLERTVALRARGLAMPLNGCEMQGTYGHRWRDQWGPHSLVEVAFDQRAERYFADRAAARDLALFVRSGRTQAIRRQTGAALRRLLQARYGNRIVALASRRALPPVGEVGYWIGGKRTLFVERSPTAARFFVELVGGKIRRHNLSPLAFVF